VSDEDRFLVTLTKIRQVFAHTHLVRGGSVMVQPTADLKSVSASDFEHTHLVRGGSLIL